jgi:hypothetical protein
VETPEPPPERTVARLGRAAQGRGLAAATWAGRGDEARGLAVLALAVAGASFVCLFLPWLGFGGRDVSGWSFLLGTDYGLLSLAVVLVELLAVARAWISRSSELVAFCLTAAGGLIGVSAVADLRWGSLEAAGGFSSFRYGAWLGLVLAILLIVLAALELSVLRRSAP